jgi:hypothetical protein
MRTKKRFLFALILMVVLLSATSTRPTQGYLCNPPYGFCYSYCVREYDGFAHCISASWNGYFCAYISGGCYGTTYCDDCM